MSRATWASRVLFTLVAPLVVLLSRRVPLAGVDTESFAAATGFFNLGNLSVGALGIMPLLGAAAIVELLALAVPAWRPWREDAEGRLRLTRYMIVLSVVLALFQAWGITKLITGIDETGSHLRSPWLVVLSLSAGYCVTLITAALVSARGLMNGVIAVILSAWAIALAEDVVAWARAGDQGTVTAVHAIALSATAVATILGATVFIVSRARSIVPPHGAAAGGNPYRSTPRRPAYAVIPAPACGVIAAVMAIQLVALPSLLAGVGVTWPWQAHDAHLYVLGVGLSIVLTLLFHPPRRLIEAWAAPDDEMRAARARAMATSVAYTLLLLAVPVITGDQGVHVGTVAVALLGGALVNAWRFASVPPTLEPVAVYHRPYEAEAARARLERAGIAVHLKDYHTRTLLHFFGPYVPIVALVPADGAPRAREILEGTAEPVAPVRAPFWPPVFGCLLALVALLGVDRGLVALYAKPPEPPPAPAKLELVAIADDVEWLEPLTTADDLPPGVRFDIENVPLGPDVAKPAFYARVTNESFNTAMKQWFDERAPDGYRVAWEKAWELDPDAEQFIHVGWRSYLLHEHAWLDGTHVADAVAQTDPPDFGPTNWYVLVTLTPDGAQRFAEATAHLVKRRLAIVIDGIVESAPQIRERIEGDALRITMGPGSPEQQREDATRLAASLARSTH